MTARLQIAPWAAVLFFSGAGAAVGAAQVRRQVEAVSGREKAAQEVRLADLGARIAAGPAPDAAAASAIRKSRLVPLGAFDHFLSNLGPDWRLATRARTGEAMGPCEDRAELILRAPGIDQWAEVLRVLSISEASGFDVLEFEARTTLTHGVIAFAVVRIGLSARSVPDEIPFSHVSKYPHQDS